MENFSRMPQEEENSESINTNKTGITSIAENFKRDASNNLIFTSGTYDESDIGVGMYVSAHSWIGLKKCCKFCLIKNFAYSSGTSAYNHFIKNNGEKGIEISKYNNIIIPYIATEIFNVDAVEYLFAKFARGKQKIPVNPNIEYLITLDEKANGEEVWEGLNILFYNRAKDTSVFSERLEEIVKFLTLRHMSSHKIQEIRDEFIRQEIFKKAVEYVDNHNLNWALGIKDRKVRVFPTYDFDFCSGIKNATIYQTLADNGKSDLKSFIIQYKDLPWMKIYMEEVIQNFDMERVFGVSYDKTKITIPTEVREYFENFYSKKKSELEQIFAEMLQDKPKGDDERCV